MAKKRTKLPTKQTIVRHHSDWMRLVERSGPFLSMPVLLDIFPQGLSKDDRERRVPLRDAYETWQTDNHDIAVHRAWVKYVLTQALEIPEEHIVDSGHIPTNLSVRVDVHHETLAPDMALIEPEDTDENQPAMPRMILMIVPPDQALDKKLPGKTWSASPQTRMSDLVRGCNDQGITFGLLTNGEKWMLVYSKQGETASFTTWYASIWFDEKVTLRAFRDLLSARRFYGDPDRTLDKLFERSAEDQHEVTDQLGLQVRDAIETIVSAIDEIDRDRNRKLLKGFSEEQLYEACVTVMMRLVFLFFAEERRLLPVKESFYEQNYSLHTLFEQLQAQKNAGEEELEWCYSGWCRLLALFRAIHGGVQHDDMQLHAYGSSLFDPDRFPFLEGRPQGTKWRELESQPLPINDRTLLHVLEALKLLEVRGIGGGQRITRIMSFRELDVEDIGHIYESLLDHTAKRAKGHVLGLVGSKGKEPELSLDEMEKQAKQSREALVDYLKAETGKTPKSIEKLLDAETKIDESRLLAACGNDQAFTAQVKPFANLVRENRSGDPIIIPDGSVYVTEGTDRRSSGTHYTPRSLTEPIVQHTLEPLVYEGPAEGKPQDEWKLKTPAEILELNICDMACGSGAFLVQACRYMAERLVEAWQHIEQNTEALADDSQTDTSNTVVGSVEAVEMVVETNPQYATNKTVRRPRITPLGEVSKNDPSEELIPLDPAERLIYARRIVAARCLYGVDVNPLATEMGKLSLWLLTLAKDKPFTFLNHAIRCGDSLLGLKKIEQLRYFSLAPDADDAVLFSGPIEDAVDEAITLRNQLEGMPTLSISDVEAKTQLLSESDDKLARMRSAADLLVAAEFWNENKSDINEATRHAAVVSGHYVERGPTDEFQEKASLAVDGKNTFHWTLEFPEVFHKGGFDAFIGNPPFMGGGKISSEFGSQYSEWLHKKSWPHAHGNADLVAYFFLRASELIGENGSVGLIATNTIGQGDTADTGLRFLVTTTGMTIFRAEPSRKWPGLAAVFISTVQLTNGNWIGSKFLDGVPTDSISPTLSVVDTTIPPAKLQSNLNLSSEGSKLYSKGFVFDEATARELLIADKNADEVVRPFNTGSDFNKSPTQSPSRWCVDFRNMEQEEVKSRWPNVYKYVEKNVKPGRQKVSDKRARELWWRHQRTRTELYEKARSMEQVLCKALVTSVWGFAFVPTNQVFANKLTVFLLDTWPVFGVLQSSFHESWAWAWGSTMKSDLNYSHSDCFQTFPFPGDMLNENGSNHIQLANIAERFYSAREQIMTTRSIGLTATYSLFNNSSENDNQIRELRQLQVELDQECLNSYGWSELQLHHGFHEANGRERFTISEAAKNELLIRLLSLNRERSSSGSTTESTKKKKTKNNRKAVAAAGLLFDDEG